MIEINKYKRNDVFIEEINNSTIEQQPIQESIINFVPGFSKKGKFNAPALIRTKADREAIYGPIDRTLELKDSWFHRTIDVALSSGPIWGLSLLKTTTDDKLNYKSVSLSPQTDNGVSSVANYSSFFNKSGFWYRDTESVINSVNDVDRILHFTNMSDKKISVFVFKSPLTNLDVTLESWYGSNDKVPTYLYPTDLVSDYMVRVVILSGDWSNYKVLSNDITWGKYFNSDGLNKDKVDSFLNEKTVNVLGKYDVSLIPYFRDKNNTNIFIESVINQYTDRTGLFCAFNIDKFETAYQNGLVDLTGHTLVYLKNKLTNPIDKESIDFLSYKNSIIETETYNESKIDRIGNVCALGAPIIESTYGNSRTGFNTPGYISGLTINQDSINAAQTAIINIDFEATDAYAILYGQKVSLNSFNISLTAMPVGNNSSESNFRKVVFYITSNGNINTSYSNIVVADETTDYRTLDFTFNTEWANGDLVLGYIITISNGLGFYNVYYAVAIDQNGYVAPLQTQIIINNIVTTNTVSIMGLEFTNVIGVNKFDLQNWRGKQFFDNFLALHGDSRAVICFDNGIKIPISAFTWVDTSLSTSSNKTLSLVLNTLQYGPLDTIYDTNTLTIYGIDDEFEMGKTSISAPYTASTSPSTNGIASKNSKFYLDFYNGLINTGNYFYVKVKNTGVRFVHNTTDGYNYVIVHTANIDSNFISGYKMWIPDHTGNSGVFTLTANGSTSVSGLSLSSETAYRVSQSVITSGYQTVDIYSYGDKVYLKLYTINDVLTCQFYADNTFTATYTIPSGYFALNNNIKVYSDANSYEQTLEIDTVVSDNKILVSSSRYAEIIIGNYLEAYVDYELLDVNVVPKSFTRIISKKKVNNNLVEITTDAKIKLYTYGNALQTNRYTNVEDYVSTYKAITLDGFTVRSASLPDGTESRQSDLLDIMAKDTPLYDAIVNKNKFSFRYLIDSLGNGLTEFSKQQLVDICGGRVACIGFINMPSIKKFKKSSSPSFTDIDGNLIVSYIKDGGNLESNPAFLYSFAEGIGQTSVGYFTPYVQVNENGRPIMMPPSSYVANTYMRKNNSTIGGKYTYTIAAGIEDGRVNGIADVEYDFTEKDLEALFEMKANPIISNRNNVFSIENEFTAQRDIQSSLTYLHSREVLIEIENELYNLLLPYKQKFNTVGIRTEIKRKADNLLQKYKDRGALYAYYNIIDETNNTQEIIDNALGLLQTYVEIVKGMGIVLGIISIEKTGSINSSGFLPNG